MIEESKLISQGVNKGNVGYIHLIEIKDKTGELFKVQYFKFSDSVVSNFVDPRVVELIPQLKAFILQVFPRYDKDEIESVIDKFDKNKSFDLVMNTSGEVVGFHIYLTTEVEGYGDNPARVIYVDHEATRPDYEGRGLTTIAGKAVYDVEDPDVICGSSANPAIFGVNMHIAKEKGFILYPQGSETPKKIFTFAEKTYIQMGLDKKATLKRDLRRTYSKGQVSKGKGVHPLAGSLPLGDAQHYYYMMFRPKLHQAILDSK